MSTRNRLRIGITAGDPDGIGYEIITKLFSDPRIVELFTPVVYANRSAMDFYREKLKDNYQVNFNYISDVEKAVPRRVNFISADTSSFVPQPGRQTSEGGRSSVASLKAMVSDAHKDALDAVVTGPIDKNNTYGDQFPFVGHTGYFAAEFPAPSGPLMFMVSENIRVGLVTTHTPISQVSTSITVESILSHIHLMRRSLIEDFACTNPKIAVLSLNPHSGDGGVIGSEEKDIIAPAIKAAEAEGIIVSGPFAADGFFGSSSYRKFDAVLAMYHDQGLAPFKSLAVSGGVNFTAGLPIVRTSPAHGVGYDIAGTGKADASSMREAIFAAVDIVRNRRLYSEISANPLRYCKRRGNEKFQHEKNVDEMIPETEN